MLLAVEGGGFFSSSASGYSKGLTFLLGQRNKDKPMRVWDHYQLMDQQSDIDLSGGCVSYACLGRSSAKEREVTEDRSSGEITMKADVPRSSMKKEDGSDIQGCAERRRVRWTDACGSELVEVREFEPSEVGGSDDEYDTGNEKSCSCVIM